MTRRVELDECRITVTLDPDNDRGRVGQLYRHGHRRTYVEQDGRVTIVADVPRHLLGSMERTAR
ncbi:MAG: hypothetical protein U0Q11_04280 [Vicinamibacterales bacterium]